MDKFTNQIAPKLASDADSPLSAAVAARDGSVIAMVDDALRHNQALLAFHPVVQARAPHDVAFYEGLIRVLDPTGRIIPPAQFMAQVENGPLGRELDCAALQIGLQMLARNRLLRLAVNMSARSIGYKRWNGILDSHLKGDPTVGERLILEISEDSAMTVPELVTDFMDYLQDYGIAFSLDHFGAGLTGLRYFNQLFFDAVKIDGTIVHDIQENPNHQVLARALIGAARAFDMLVIAENVQTQAEADVMISLGVDCLQGNLFGAPSLRLPWETPIAARAAQA